MPHELAGQHKATSPTRKPLPVILKDEENASKLYFIS
jgi:hypothetical protein